MFIFIEKNIYNNYIMDKMSYLMLAVAVVGSILILVQYNRKNQKESFRGGAINPTVAIIIALVLFGLIGSLIVWGEKQMASGFETS
jgi:phosphatidylserine synthase